MWEKEVTQRRRRRGLGKGCRWNTGAEEAGWRNGPHCDKELVTCESSEPCLISITGRLLWPWDSGIGVAELDLDGPFFILNAASTPELGSLSRLEVRVVFLGKSTISLGRAG